MRILALDERHLRLKIDLRYVYAENVTRVMDTVWIWIIFIVPALLQ